MAFGFQYLSLDESTQQFYSTYNSVSGNVTSPIQNGWKYNATATGANDTAAAVVAANYFNGAVGYMNVGDRIYFSSNNGVNRFIAVTGNDGTNVTTAALN